MMGPAALSSSSISAVLRRRVTSVETASPTLSPISCAASPTASLTRSAVRATLEGGGVSDVGLGDGRADLLVGRDLGAIAVPCAGTALWNCVSGELVMNFLSLLCPCQDIEHLQDDTEKYRYKKQHCGNPAENSGPSAAAAAESSHHGDLDSTRYPLGKSVRSICRARPSAELPRVPRRSSAT
jgi:hypothetical protein